MEVHIIITGTKHVYRDTQDNDDQTGFVESHDADSAALRDPLHVSCKQKWF